MEKKEEGTCEIPRYCPKCSKPLEFRQINLDTALLFCMDVYCPYPIMEPCIVIKRKLKDMHKPFNWKIPDKPKDFDKELEEYLEKEQARKQNSQSCEATTMQNSQTLVSTNDDWFDEWLKNLK